MKMRDVIAHMRVVDGALRLGLPGVIGRFIIREDPDDMQVIDILEDIAAGIDQFSSEDEVQALGHEKILVRVALWRRVFDCRSGSSEWRARCGCLDGSGKTRHQTPSPTGCRPCPSPS